MKFVVYGGAELGPLSTWQNNVIKGLTILKHEFVDSQHLADAEYILCFSNPKSTVTMLLPPEDTVLFTTWPTLELPGPAAVNLRDFAKVIVPGPMTQRVLKEAGIASDIVPVGADPEVFYPDGIAHGRPRFFADNEWLPSTGIHVLIQAFFAAFKDPTAELFVKTWSTMGMSQLDFNEFVTHARKEADSKANVFVVTSIFEPGQLREVMGNCDAYVTAAMHTAGASCVEAMASGLPPIAPMGTDADEYLGGAWRIGRGTSAWPLYYQAKTAPAPPWVTRFGPEGPMLHPDAGQLQERFKYAAGHMKEVHELGRQVAAKARRWSPTRIAERLVNALPPPIAKPKPEAQPQPTPAAG